MVIELTFRKYIDSRPCHIVKINTAHRLARDRKAALLREIEQMAIDLLEKFDQGETEDANV